MYRTVQGPGAARAGQSPSPSGSLAASTAARQARSRRSRYAAAASLNAGRSAAVAGWNTSS